ncbi:dual-specificity tyrosine-(Y)-phosphorylation regulated kinase [Angomonas deanei]|uniref:dual-specificity kinase n=1 Tax=Angomonas deanei TaxID=59799 RepID=A0A7G2CA78_9TRYP|nr:dual-specificity tyrosine-(Y)-phosphorylation regulated kinase [Angomonas deanei]CAD2215663.1 Protein kinase domain/Protein tyrosine kinase, putative [Angomonas deanei]|eukprot:EPY22841.1 dual-specificity tyrosine-(Y)-phosphorylation regulated kinase [Angomonas deanei]
MEPIPLAKVLSVYGNILTEYEKQEIKQFNEIFYVGQNCKNKVPAPCSGMNNGYDKAEGEYNILIGDHIAYRYEILGELGSGAFGQVVKVIDHYDKSVVAIKLIRNRRKIALQARQEIKILRFIAEEDPEGRFGLVTMFESFTFRGHVCIVYELLGVSLYDQMKAHDFYPMKMSVVRQIAARMLISLTFMYKKNIMHCDLKPENILLREENSTLVKVVDLGSACFDETNPLMYIQSRFYRAPEIILGCNYGKAIDLWSFGCILCEIATGWPIFAGEDEEDQFHSIAEYLGAPPAQLLQNSRYKNKFCLEDGTVKEFTSKRGKKRVPGSKTIAGFLALPEDDDFVSFVSLFLRWIPEERTEPREAMNHDFVSEEFDFDRPPKEKKPAEEKDTSAFARNRNAGSAGRNRIARPSAPIPRSSEETEQSPASPAAVQAPQPPPQQSERQKQGHASKTRSVPALFPQASELDRSKRSNTSHVGSRKNSIEVADPTAKPGTFKIVQKEKLPAAVSPQTKKNPYTRKVDAPILTSTETSTNNTNTKDKKEPATKNNNNNNSNNNNNATNRNNNDNTSAEKAKKEEVEKKGRDRALSLHPLNQNGQTKPAQLPEVKLPTLLSGDIDSPSPKKAEPDVIDPELGKRRTSKSLMDKINIFEQLSQSNSDNFEHRKNAPPLSGFARPAPSESIPADSNNGSKGRSDTSTADGGYSYGQRTASNTMVRTSVQVTASSNFDGQYSVLRPDDDIVEETRDLPSALQTPDRSPPPTQQIKANTVPVPAPPQQGRATNNARNTVPQRSITKSAPAAVEEEDDIVIKSARPTRSAGRRRQQNSVMMVPENK